MGSPMGEKTVPDVPTDTATIPSSITPLPTAEQALSPPPPAIGSPARRPISWPAVWHTALEATGDS